MTPRNDKERLLADVLGEESEAGFHAALLGETLRLAQRRRRIRQARRVGGVLAAIATIVTVAFWRNPRERVAIPQPAARSHQLTLTQSLPAARTVSTRPLSTGQMVVSTAIAGVIRTTATSGGYRELGDDELLALAPQPTALVRRGPREAELVFVNSSGAEGPHRN